MTAARGYGSPHFYDLTGDWLGPDQPEVRFYLEHARSASHAVEIGAGTGRIAVELAARKVTQPAPQATDMVVARKLWDISAEMVHLADGPPAKT